MNERACGGSASGASIGAPGDSDRASGSAVAGGGAPVAGLRPDHPGDAEVEELRRGLLHPPDHQTWERAAALFDEALELPPCLSVEGRHATS